MDNFEVLGFLGEGAFGVVMRCRDKTTGRQCAVKEFEDLMAEEMGEVFPGEFELLSALKHDNLIQVVSQFEQEGLMYCVFELMAHSIADQVNMLHGGLESKLMQEYTFQTLCGINYLHSVNIIHRDIKPENLLVSYSGVVKVADLGSSRVLNGNKREEMTRSVGTLCFLSPEALTGDHFYYMSHDVWAFGCTVFAMANPIVFYEELCENFLEQILTVVNTVGPLTKQQQQGFCTKFPMSRLPVPARLPTDLQQKYKLSDPLLAQLIEACLQMEPDSRATCSQLLDHEYFTWDSFHQRFPQELAKRVLADQQWVPEYSSLKSSQDSSEDSSLDSYSIAFDTIRPHKDSCNPEISPDAVAVSISPDVPQEAVPLKRKGRLGARFRHAIRNIRCFFARKCHIPPTSSPDAPQEAVPLKRKGRFGARVRHTIRNIRCFFARKRHIPPTTSPDVPQEAVSISPDVPQEAVSISPDVPQEAVSISPDVPQEAVSISPDVPHEAVSISPDIPQEAVSISLDVPQEAVSISLDVPQEAVSISPDVPQEAVSISSDVLPEAVAISPDVFQEAVAISPDVPPESVAISPDVPQVAVAISPDVPQEAVCISQDVPPKSVAVSPDVPQEAVALCPDIHPDRESVKRKGVHGAVFRRTMRSIGHFFNAWWM